MYVQTVLRSERCSSRVSAVSGSPQRFCTSGGRSPSSTSQPVPQRKPWKACASLAPIAPLISTAINVANPIRTIAMTSSGGSLALRRRPEKNIRAAQRGPDRSKSDLAHDKPRQPADDQHDERPDPRRVDHRLAAVDGAADLGRHAVRLAGEGRWTQALGHAGANETRLHAHGPHSLRAELVVQPLEIAG